MSENDIDDSEGENEATPEVDSPVEKIEWLAGFLKIPKSTAYALVRENRLPAECVLRLGTTVRVDRDEVKKWYASRTQGSVAS